MASVFAWLRDFFRQPPHDSVASTREFLDISVEKLKRDLSLLDRGAARGSREEPASDVGSLDIVEQEIVDRIEGRRRSALQQYNDGMQAYARRLNAQSIEGFSSAITTHLSSAKADFHALVHNGSDRLYAARLQVIDAERSYDHFRRRHDLVEMARFPESRYWHFGVLAVVLAIEVGCNGVMLSVGHVGGLLGGAAVAALIAAVNVLVLGFLAGAFFLRLAHHRRTWIKLLGVFGCLLILIVAFVGNLAVAHYRDALGGPDPESAGRLAIDSLRAAPFAIQDVNSWILFVMGFAFCVIGAVDGLVSEDPYPGYGARARRRKHTQEDYAAEKEGLIEDLTEKRDDCVERATSDKREIDKRIAERSQIMDARKGYQVDFENHLQHLEEAANKLLAIYRDANLGLRKSPPPPHFKKRWVLKRYNRAEVIVSPAMDDRQIAAAVRKAREEMDVGIQELNKAYQQAFRQYGRIEDLSEEDVRREQKTQQAA